MEDTIRADIDEIRVVSVSFDSNAETVSRIDTRGVVAGAAEGFSGGAAIVTALGSAEAAMRRAISMIADRAWSLADTLDRVGADYEHTDAYLAAELAAAVPE
ncbi:hypothetical protein ACFWCF_14005 [Rhodococcus sp. NPDC060090]|uniref:hypothetical protein n=1 Tax=Rhodococcus sp. NPDC060090 TaxID=3347056 RepID=UPI0036545889